MKPILWAELPFDNLQARRNDGVDAALLPIGGTMPHGTHLPTGTDSLIVETLCHAISARTAVPVLPTISTGFSARPGALSLSPATLTAVVSDTLESAFHFGMRRMIVLSANAENMPAIECALQALRARHEDIFAAAKTIWDATPQTRDAWHSDTALPHAGLAETALVQFLAPHLAGSAPPASPPEKERVFPREDENYSGAPESASAELGEELFEALVSGWTRFVKRALIEKRAETFTLTNPAPSGNAPLFRAPGSNS